jgi:hypothetical protein
MLIFQEASPELYEHMNKLVISDCDAISVNFTGNDLNDTIDIRISAE